MKKRTLLILLVVAAAAAGLYTWREWQRGVKGAAELDVSEKLAAASLLGAFTGDEPAANARFNEKVVQVSGTVRSIGAPENGKVSVTLETGDPLAGIVCEFAQADAPAWRAGQQVEVKGICTGLLMDVILVRCAAVE